MHTLSNSKLKQYTLITSQHILNNYSKGTVRRSVQLQSFIKYFNSYKVDLVISESILKDIKSSTLPNLDIYVDTILIKDDVVKLKIISELQVAEYSSTTTKTVKPLSPQMLKTTRETLAAQKEIINIIDIVEKSVKNFSLTDCKKLKAALGSAIYE